MKKYLVILSILLGSVLTAKKETSFVAYWNVPSFQCTPHNVNFAPLLRKYNILHNKNADFRGDTLAILYDPGAFPAILSSDVLRNGGVPQEGNLQFHLEAFKKSMDELIPNEEFPGIGVIDFESWRPVFRQNFGTLTPYRNLSIDIERQKHPTWSASMVKKHAGRLFEKHGKPFMEETLLYAKVLRPNATWGYYAYPYCFNMNPNNKRTECPVEVVKENDRINWLFKAKDTFHPSLYLQQYNFNPKERLQLIAGRIEESHRIIANLGQANPLIMPYFCYKYQDSFEFLTKNDLYNSLYTLRRLVIDGLIIWGSSNDVDTKEDCQKLYQYIDTVLGPALLKL